MPPAHPSPFSAEMPSDQTPIVRHKLADQVYERLWEMIRSGVLAPGDYMPSERALMERFGVGRPAIREALQSLANRGLISISHGERSRVNRLNATTALQQIDDLTRLMLAETPSNVAHLRELRELLETATLRIAAPRCTPQKTAELRALIEAQRATIGHKPAFIAEDIKFHVAIAAMTGNPIVEAVTRAMMAWLLEIHEGMLHWDGQEQLTLNEHTAVVDALERHDGAAASAVMLTHLGRLGAPQENTSAP